jgi:hypothetical protein
MRPSQLPPPWRRWGRAELGTGWESELAGKSELAGNRFGIGSESGVTVPDSSVLDVLIGLALLFAAFSLAVSRINEAVLGMVNYRGRQLEAELRRLLGGDPNDAPRTSGATPPPPDATTRLLDGPLRAMRTPGHNTAPADMRDHPKIGGAWTLVRRARKLRLPSYIPSKAFAQALLDDVEPPARAMLTQLRPDTLPARVSDEARAVYQRAYEAAQRSLDRETASALHAAMPLDHPAGRVLSAALIDASGSNGVGTLETGLAGLLASPAKAAMTAAIVWYDEAMDRLSGWYKRRVAIFLFGYAVLLATLFNLDAIGIARSLWQDRTVREVAVTASYDAVRSSPDAADAADGGDGADAADGAGGASSGDGTSSDSTGDQPAPSEATEATEAAIKAVRDASALALPMGWVRADDDREDPREVPESVDDWLLKIMGLLIGCLALTAGAPFWFDLLGRLVNMRDTGPKPRPVSG